MPPEAVAADAYSDRSCCSGDLGCAYPSAKPFKSVIDGISVWLQEFKHMPLRLSRQMLLDHWNEAIAFVSATLDARLAGGNDDAGVP